MISTSNLTLAFGANVIFEDVNIRFLTGNCYGLIGANGAGKSTFLKILSGEIETTKGQVTISPGKRLAVLKQDQFAYDEYEVLDTVLMGHQALYQVYAERKELYAKAQLSDAEGLRVGDLENLFGEMDGYSAESDAASMLSSIGITEDLQGKRMKELESGQKIRVLLAQALFGNPDVLLLDEPTNQLDYLTVLWLENYLLEFKNTVIVVSHDRHFLNKVCTHIADVDYKHINIYPGNYDFWQKASELALKQKQDKNKQDASKIKELEEFVRRFSANASKSKQATSRKKLIEKLRPDELPVSSRKSPYINFKPKRVCGTKIIHLEQVSHSLGATPILNNVSLTVEKGDKIALIGQNSIAKTTLLQILAGELKPDAGKVIWGDSVDLAYYPKDNAAYFQAQSTLIDWLSQFMEKVETQLLRGLLGRMLFSGEAVNKDIGVLSGGEKARAMFSKMMLAEANTLIFDDPTDHLDLESISALNDGLESFPGCLVFTSHDFQLLNTVANRVIEILPKGMLDQRTTFDDYMQSENIQEKRHSLS